MAHLFQNIVVATDGSPSSQTAAKTAAELAAQLGARITLIYVFEPIKYALPEGYVPYTSEQLTEMTEHFEQMLRSAKTEVTAAGATQVETRLLQGVAADEICEFAKREGADLIVVGTHGRGLIERVLLGSVAEKVVRSASVPVLTVRTP
jgi:nucleotide-binding universal stress UspA family protein